MASSPPPIHPALQPIAFLLGKWRGEGEGGYPTISAFKYGEEVQFGHSGKPAMSYSQKTWKAASGEPMHAETGFWRPKPDGTLDVVIAQSTGITEVEKGEYNADSQQVTVESASVGNAAKVTRIARKFAVEGDTLTYQVFMETTSQPLQLHLSAKLKKSASVRVLSPPLGVESMEHGKSTGVEHDNRKNVNKGVQRLERHSGTGRSGEPKKGGSGGKHVWGSVHVDMDPEAPVTVLDDKDPMFDPDESGTGDKKDT